MFRRNVLPPSSRPLVPPDTTGGTSDCWGWVCSHKNRSFPSWPLRMRVFQVDEINGREATSSEEYNGGPLYLHYKRLAHCAAGDNITLNRSHVINLPFYRQNPSSYVAATEFCPLQRSWTLNEKNTPSKKPQRKQLASRRWRRYYSPKRLLTFSILHGVISPEYSTLHVRQFLCMNEIIGVFGSHRVESRF
jgi:hypothetical protein